MPSKVCLASIHYYPAYSGPALRFSRYIPGLLVRGIDLRVFCGTPDIEDAASSELEDAWRKLPTGRIFQAREENGPPVFSVRLPDGGRFRRTILYNKGLVDFCSQPAHRPALVHFLSLSLWSVPWLLRFKRLQIPTVFTHTLLGKLSPNPVKRQMQIRYIRLPFQLVDQVIVSSQAMRAALLDLGVSTPIQVIPNGVNLEMFKPPANGKIRQAIRQAHGIGPDELVIASVGPITPRKGTDLLAAAWVELLKSCPEAHLLLVGPRHDLAYPHFEGFRQKIAGLVERSGKPGQVHFTGAVENVPEYLQAADIFAFASEREGMPNAIPEAMAAGLPIVTTTFLGFPAEFGQAGEHYLLAERDACSFGQALQSLASNPARRKALGASARKWAEATMDVQKSIDQYAQLYQRYFDSEEK